MQFKYSAQSLQGNEKYIEKLIPYIKHLKNVRADNNYDYNESFINTPFDTNVQKEIILLAQKLEKSKPDLIYVFGIGGSDLAGKAFATIFGKSEKIIYFDSFDLDYINNYLTKNFTKNKKILPVLISKNGRTIESSYFSEILGITPIVITANESLLFEKVEKMDVEKLLFSPKIGGRYSAFTSANLFPLLFEGINILKICKGAKRAVAYSMEEKLESNLPLLSAITIYKNLLKGKYILDTFVFKQNLENLGKWLRQLYGESLGKNGVELFPTVSVGTSDLHSTYQRYLGGKNNIFTNFLYLDEKDLNIKTPETLKYSFLEEIGDKTPKQILESIYKGVLESYRKGGREFVEFIFDRNNLEEDLGEFISFKMIETIFLAQLLNVNAFDQPEVEMYKSETQKLLQK